MRLERLLVGAGELLMKLLIHLLDIWFIYVHGLARIHRAGATFSKPNTTTSLITSIMAPTTPKKRIPKTGRREYDTIKRNRFFSAFDSASDGTTPGDIARRPDIDIPPSTARTWLAKRD